MEVTRSSLGEEGGLNCALHSDDGFAFDVTIDVVFLMFEKAINAVVVAAVFSNCSQRIVLERDPLATK